MKKVLMRTIAIMLIATLAMFSLIACATPQTSEVMPSAEATAQESQEPQVEDLQQDEADQEAVSDSEGAQAEEVSEFTIIVDEVIDIASRGPFVMGTIESGTIKNGDTVKVLDEKGGLIAESLSTDLVLLDDNSSVASAQEGQEVGVLFYHEFAGSLDAAHTMVAGVPQAVEEEVGDDVDYLALIEEVKSRPGITEFAASVASMSFEDDTYTTQLTLYAEDETVADSKDRFTYQPENRSGYELTTEEAEDVIILVDAVNGYKQVPMDEYFKYAGKNSYYTIFRYYMQDDELVMMAEVNFLNP